MAQTALPVFLRNLQSDVRGLIDKIILLLLILDQDGRKMEQHDLNHSYYDVHLNLLMCL